MDELDYRSMLVMMHIVLTLADEVFFERASSVREGNCSFYIEDAFKTLVDHWGNVGDAVDNRDPTLIKDLISEDLLRTEEECLLFYELACNLDSIAQECWYKGDECYRASKYLPKVKQCALNLLKSMLKNNKDNEYVVSDMKSFVQEVKMSINIQELIESP